MSRSKRRSKLDAKKKTVTARKLSIKKGATVEVVAGADRGKKGTVLDVDKQNLKVKVQGVRVLTHFDRKEGQFTAEGYVDYSNVKLVAAAQPKAAKKKKKASASK